MKGLLLKDWYMAKKYCRSYLLIVLVFFAVAFLGEGSTFFVFYPCVMIGLLPVTLLAYDERCKWDAYCGTLPYSREKLVSEKYLLGIISELAVLVIAGIVCAAKMGSNGSLSFEAIFNMLAGVAAAATVISSITLPLMFKVGVEKGRIAYYVMIGAMCAVTVIIPSSLNFDMHNKFALPFAPIAIAVGLFVYALSWRLSVAIYKKREI